MSGIKDTDYVYLSAYVRGREASLLTGERLARMAAAPDFDEAAKVLTECGYPELAGASDAEVEEVLSDRRSAILKDIESICPEKALMEAFRLRYDYHNAKVLVKADGAGVRGEHLYSGAGRVSPGTLKKAYTEDDYRPIPAKLAAAMRQAKSTLARTANPQLTDMGLDRAYFAELLSLTETLSDGFYTEYIRLSIDLANLRSAVRCVRSGLDEGVLKAALLPGGTVSPARISRSVYGEGVTSVFTDSELSQAAELGQKSIEGAALSAFERACDNALTHRLQNAKLVSFGPAAAVAYLASMENELVAVRMVLLGKRGGADPETLRERLRDSYV